jgi:hypothetical protein
VRNQCRDVNGDVQTVQRRVTIGGVYYTQD